MNKEFKTLNAALDVLERSPLPEHRANAYLFRHLLWDYDLDEEDTEPEQESTQPKGFWRTIGSWIGLCD